MDRADIATVRDRSVSRAGTNAGPKAALLGAVFRVASRALLASARQLKRPPGGIMFEDQTIELLPARTTLQTGGAGGRGGRGGDALAVSAAAIAVGGRNSGALSATSADATATGGNGGNGGDGGSVTP